MLIRAMAIKVIRRDSFTHTQPYILQGWGITHTEAPVLFLGAKFCNPSTSIENGLLPGAMPGCGSGRSEIFFSARLPHSESAGGASCEGVPGEHDHDTQAKISPYTFDSEIIVTLEKNIAVQHRCVFFTYAT